MSTWESIGSTYIEAVTSVIPIHRLALLVVGFVGAVAVRSQTHRSIVETAINLKVADLLNVDSPLLASATLGDVMTGVALVVAGWAMARLLLRGVFLVAELTTQLRKRVDSLSSQPSPLVGELSSERESEVKLLEALLVKPRLRLRRLNVLGEMLCGVAAGAAVAWWWGNALDLVVAMTLILAAVATEVMTVRVFLRDYLGPALLKARLLGQQLPTAIDD